MRFGKHGEIVTQYGNNESDEEKGGSDGISIRQMAIILVAELAVCGIWFVLLVTAEVS